MSAFNLASSMQSLSLADDHSAIVTAAKKDWKILPALFEELSKKAALPGKDNVEAAAGAVNVFKALAEGARQVSEPYLVANISTLLIAAAHKQTPVRKAAVEAANVIVAGLTPSCVREIIGRLFVFVDIQQNWQSRALAMNLVAAIGGVAPAELGLSLPRVVPELTPCMTDTKKEVAAAAHAAMTASCDVIGNRDIEHMTTHILRSITHPADVPEIMHKLAGVTFVQSVESPALAMVVPLLMRGLKSRITATRRQAAVIIDNMSKLVDDPLDAAPFLPQLMPAVARAAEAMSDPEARKICERATNQLQRLHHDATTIQTKEIDHDLISATIKTHIKADCAVALYSITEMVASHMHSRDFDIANWEDVINALGVVAPKAAEAAAAILPIVKDMVKLIVVEEEDDDAEELCNCNFTLAYGTKILLHNTVMRLKRGAKYGLLGGNDSGKTTLMRSIANGSVEGFPDANDVRTVFVEADIMGELSHLSCVDYIMEDARLSHLSREEVMTTMATVGFTEDGKAKPNHAVSTLSGGWRMKLAMARAMLQRADILLLDEPTNHLDVINVAWVKNYINSLTDVTAVMVSHDSGFLNDCCTDILQIDRLKLHHYKGNLDSFMEKNPEAKAYFSLKESKLRFRFPNPGPIQGVKSRSKALMKMSHCDFTYPVNKTPTLFDISIQVSMASRVGCVGENGAGKSTMIKVLTGEVVPQTGEVWKHPNARVAYVAQHAFHHIEDHLDKTPNEYIRWRYANGEDKESLVKVSMVLTEEERKIQCEPFEVKWVDDDGKDRSAKKIVSELMGSRRDAKGKEFEYEVRYKGGDEGWLMSKQLSKRGWDKMMRAIDARIAQRAGLAIMTLSSANVEKHLNDVGLDAEFATHYRMSALSGGQKVKVVLAAAMWNQPHILILDEPTNYLDRESLGALAGAIEEYEGGVVIISHNNEFVSTLCPEEWVMDNGRLTTKGIAGWMNRQDDKISDTQVITEMTDALGNTSAVTVVKELSKKEIKAKIKAMKKKISAGDVLDTDDEEFAIANELM